MYAIYNKVVKVFENYPNVLFGFSNIDYSEFRMRYMGALVFAVPHAEMLKIDNYKPVD